MPTLQELEEGNDNGPTGPKGGDPSPSASSRSSVNAPGLGPLNESPGGKQRKETRRVTASPAISGALAPRSPNADQSPPPSPKRSTTSPNQSPASSAESSAKSIGGGIGRKRKATEDSDIENEGDGNEQKARRTGGASSLSAEFDLASNDSDSDASGDELGAMPSANAPNAAGKSHITSSGDESSDEEKDTGKSSSLSIDGDSDEDSDDEGAKLASARGRRSGSSQGWLTSFHAQNAGGSDDSSDSEPDDDDDGFGKELYRYDWLNSPSKDAKLKQLNGIANDKDKALQLLLWDVGFDYSIYPHQFEAIRFVAGYVPSFPFWAGFDGGDDIDDDEDDADVQEMLQLDLIGSNARKKAMNKKGLMLEGRGMILGDEMGLGKTIEALAGAVLRNFKEGSKRKPTLIITPQDGVQQQWVESLVKAGVEPARIRVIGEKRRDKNTKKNAVGKGSYIICTRYKIMTEMRTLFQYATSSKTQQKVKQEKLRIFPQKIPTSLIRKLKHEYNVANGKERRERSDGPRVEPPDRFTKLMRSAKGLKRKFGTVVIDECHFLRNVFAFWGMGAALLGLQSERTVLLSGTPYNNGPSDMSALQTFIDPSHGAALVKWWRTATSKGKREDVIEAVSGWREDFMLRRTKETIKDKLTNLERRVVDVSVRPSEIGIYEAYEASFLWVLEQLRDDPDDRTKMKELAEILMAQAACMRMSLIHPLLPGGREATIQFSPSRKRLLCNQENKDRCVLCGDNYPSQKADEYATKMAAKVKEDEDEKKFCQLLGVADGVQTDDNILDDEPASKNKTKLDKGKGPLVPLGEDAYEGKKIACRAAGSACRHFAHERCIEVIDDCTECPRCLDLSSRLHVASASGSGHQVYCQDTLTTVGGAAGFTASSKIERAIEWFRGIPFDEKAIFMSFFKGSLDLIEGILVKELGVKCCRYDGDVAKEQRQQDLHKFKTSKKHRVLLASVQSGGTGLNIVEANNICFLDRWFNPQIHDQAESRCHRLKQKKDVKVSYLDTSYTVDVVMRHINVFKSNNAQVLLADGSSLTGTSSVDYQELSGLIGEMLKSVRDARHCNTRTNILSGDADAPLVSSNDGELESKLHEIAISGGSKKKAAKKKKTEDTSSNSNGSPGSDDDDKSRTSNASSRGDDSCSDKNLSDQRPKLGEKSEAADSDDDNDSLSSSILDESFFGNKTKTNQKANPPSSTASSRDDESDDEMFNIVFSSKAKGYANKERKSEDTSTSGLPASDSASAKNPPRKLKTEPSLSNAAASGESDESMVIDLLSDDEEENFPGTAKAVEHSLKDGTEQASDAEDEDDDFEKAIELSLQAAPQPSSSLEELQQELDDAVAARDWGRVESVNERMKELRQH